MNHMHRKEDALLRAKRRKKLEDNIKLDNLPLSLELDGLTGFSNLAFIREKIDELVNKQEPSAIFLLGLDDFSMVNDALGSYIGDFVLKQTSERLKDRLQDTHVIARKGGDEFIMIFHNDSLKRSQQRAHHILKEISQPISIGDKKIYLTGSIGISTYPQDANATEELLTCADIALRYAKSVGKNNAQHFTKKLGIKSHQRHEILAKLPHALERNEFFLCYQPQLDTRNQTIVSLEALLRWKNPRLGLIMPQYFIPLAEETAHIISIGDWVLKSACQQAKQWQLPEKSIRMAVNVSARQLQTSHKKQCLLKSIEEALAISKLPPHHLEIEITESVFMKSDLRAMQTLKKIKDIGIHIACDDFGTGYSSFHRLKQLPIDILKIDRLLIKDMCKNPVDETIIRSIIAIAKKLNLLCVAEGVEKEEQYQRLCELGCDIIQGHYFSKAVNPPQIEKLLKR